jgi:antitoxin (DNA-binding transcriptional repressor) of toxin-antitoxin stability system
MKTMTVRDIRLRWPEAEKALASEGEIVVTRDSKPVAKIIPYFPAARKTRNRFDPKEHMRWLRRISKGEPTYPSTDELLREDRDDNRREIPL